MVNNSSVAFLTLYGVLMLAPVPLRAEPPGGLRVAFYAPWAGPGEATARHELSVDMARRVQTASGRPATAKVFARYQDLMAAIREDELDYVVMDTAPALASKRFRILASWKSGESWAIVSKDVRRVKELRDRPFAMQALDSPGSLWLLDEALLGGVVRARTYFGKLVSVPRTADAAHAVEYGNAAAAVVRTRDVGLLHTLLALGEWSELVVCAVSRSPEPQDSGVAQALGASVEQALGGTWSSAAPSLPATIAFKQPLWAKPQVHKKTVADILAPMPMTLPALDIGRFWASPDESR
jgi:hypothetical protein